MIRIICRGLPAGASLSLVSALMILPAETAPLEPYQMIRSLQLVQDSIAGGDHAALPMQRKLLEMIDQRLSEASPGEFDDPRNFRALLVYGMSGGNPATIKTVLSRLPPDMAGTPVAAGVLSYLEGNAQAAMEALAPLDSMAERGELGAFLALVMGTVVGGQNAGAGLRFLDQARLLGPGTLVEEAALRRSIVLSVTIRDPERFLRLSNQYVRRFLRSPYATQFAESFVTGIVALFQSLDHEALVETISEMSRDHQEAIYLRLARAGTIDGPAALSEFAAEKAAELGSGATEPANPRAALYSSIVTIRSDTVKDVTARLKAIERDKLSEGDRQLLDAALAVATEVLSAPDWAQKAAPAAPPAPAETADEGDNAGTSTDPVQAVVDDARKRLESIDKLLEETGG